MQELKRKEDAIARCRFFFITDDLMSLCITNLILTHVLAFVLAAGIVIEEKNWPPYFPIIHHDIANEIPIHLQKMLYVAFTTLLG